MSIATEITRLQSAKADIKSAIEEKGVEVGDGTIDTYAEKIGEISVGGGIDFERYARTFQFATMEGLPEDLVLNFENATTLQGLMESFEVKNIKHLTINCSKPITNMSRMIYGYPPTSTKSFERLTLNFNTSQCGTYRQCFYSMPNLKVIDGEPLDFSSSSINGGILLYSNAIEEMRVVKNTIKVSMELNNCSMLSKATVQSVFDGLATVDTAQTLTLHANTKILQSQVDSANAKGWTVAGGVVVSEEEYYG